PHFLHFFITGSRWWTSARGRQNGVIPIYLRFRRGETRKGGEWGQRSSDQNESGRTEQSFGGVASFCAVLGQVSSAHRTDVRAINRIARNCERAAQRRNGEILVDRFNRSIRQPDVKL